MIASMVAAIGFVQAVRKSIGTAAASFVAGSRGRESGHLTVPDFLA